MLFRKRNNKCQSAGDMNRKHCQGGFTVLEMSIVLLVIAIMAAIVVPLILNWMRSYNLSIGSQDVATALQRARYLATSNNVLSGVRIGDTSAIEIIQYDQTGQGKPAKAGLVVLPSNITIDPSAPREIDFDGRGVLAPIPTEDPVIRVNGVNGYYSKVSVSPTGQVTVSGQIHQ